MGEAIQTIKAADAGISGITDLIESMKGLAQAAYTSTDVTTLEDQYDALIDQIDAMATDSGYKGMNLLDSDTLSVVFNEDGSAKLEVAGFDGSATAGLGIAVAGDFSVAANIDTAIGQLDDALAELRTQSQALSANLSVVTARQEFTNNMINVLTTGADNLTAADLNEEGANMLMLQTRQSLGTTALSLSAQAAQSVLRLF
jgi:flagellin-like hook-associated protein FlgL